MRNGRKESIESNFNLTNSERCLNSRVDPRKCMCRDRVSKGSKDIASQHYIPIFILLIVLVIHDNGSRNIIDVTMINIDSSSFNYFGDGKILY